MQTRMNVHDTQQEISTTMMLLGINNKAHYGPQQIQTWLAETAAAKMAKAGHIDVKCPGKNELSGFRKVHVRDFLDQ